MSKFRVRLLLVCLLCVASASANSIYTLTLPSSISIAPGTTGSIQGTLTVLGPDPIFVVEAFAHFIPGITCCDFHFGASLSALFGQKLAPGVYNFTFATLSVPANFSSGFVSNISSNLGLSTRDCCGNFSPTITTAFSVGSSSVGDNVTVRGTAVAGTVPEPSSLLLLGTGILSVLGVARRKLRP